MVRLTAVLFAVVSLATPAVAQDLLGGYFAEIGYEDMRNSKGKALRDFCAMIQQDRANVHKFGIRHASDEMDPWFTTLAARKTISANCRVGAGSEYIPSRVLNGEPHFVRVQVFGTGGVPKWVEVHEGAG